MGRLLTLIIAIGLVIFVLVWAGFINVSPEGERALDDARDAVGGAVEDAGQAISGDGQ